MRQNVDTQICAYPPCDQRIEVAAGHRRKQYCSDAHRQAARRLRKQPPAPEDEQITVLRTELEQERARYAALREEYMGANMKIARLERHVRRYERMKILQTRESMLHELMILGGRLMYAALTDLGIREGIEEWLAYIRTASDQDLAIAIAHGYYQADALAMAVIDAADTKFTTQLCRQIAELEADLARRNKRIAELEHPQPVDRESLRDLPALLYRLQEQQVTITRQVEEIADLEAQLCEQRKQLLAREESHGQAFYRMNLLLAQAQKQPIVTGKCHDCGVAGTKQTEQLGRL